MLDSPVWKDKIATGSLGENFVLNSIQKKYKSAYQKEGKYSAYDIYIPETNKTIEVKYDKGSLRSGNFFVELKDYEVKSGLSISTADWWCFTDLNKSYYIQREKLIDIIQDLPIRRSFCERDKHATEYVLLSKKKYLHHFKIIN